MSKSKGNVIDPIQVVEEFGTDALRMAFIVGTVPGENVAFSTEKIRAYKKFANKVWNIARFVCTEATEKGALQEKDSALLTEWRMLLKEITEEMEHYHYHLAAEKLYHYLWHTFADLLIEESKKIFEKGGEQAVSRRTLLITIFSETLRVLHPFMPFLTETIWEQMPKEYKPHEMLLVAPWPTHEV